MEKIVKKLRVPPGKQVDLGKWDPEDRAGLADDKQAGIEELLKLNERLEILQELLYAEQKHKVLVVLQGMDTSGKDGVIRHVFEGVNPQGVRVAGFKVPTLVELAHDYLWRIHQQTPGRGEIVIFNRSHYEDVLVVRVHNLVPQKIWKHRFDHINQFEKMLVEEGTTIFKFFLHIDADEQKKRLQERLDKPEKHWKFNIGDLEERKLWPEYQHAYEDVLSRTSTKWAPWYIIPANKKWQRNLAIATILVDGLESLKMEYPPSADDLSAVVIE